jgi:hypothetical protein
MATDVKDVTVPAAVTHVSVKLPDFLALSYVLTRPIMFFVRPM